MMSSSSSSSSGRNNMYPFTALQWQELEHQSLFFKYMMSGLPIPQDLLFNIRRSFDDHHHQHHSSISTKLLLHQPHHIGWNSFQMGYGRKIDPEPGRCRRTDGKKWRCSKDAFSDSKYCERHMHRGRNRSRKPVENLSHNKPQPTTTDHNNNNNKIPSLINNKSRTDLNSTFINTPPQIGLSLQENRANYGHNAVGEVDYRKSCGDGNMSGGSSISDSSSWQLEPLTLMGSPLSQMKHKADDHFYGLQQKKVQYGDNYYYNNCDNMDLNIERDDNDQHKKVMHHFLDDQFPSKDKVSWLSFEDKMSAHSTQLSISTPNSALHDFFATREW